MSLLICFKAIGGTGNSGRSSNILPSSPMAFNIDIKLLRVMFICFPCSRWAIVVSPSPERSAISAWLILAESLYSFILRARMLIIS